MILFILSTLALMFTSFTLLVRGNDMRSRRGVRWFLRMCGFIMAGFAPWGIVAHEWLTNHQPTLYEVIFRVGLAFVFMTTPYLKPWHEWFFKGVE